MNNLLASHTYDFDIYFNKLTTKPAARLFSLTDIKSAKRLLAHLKRNNVSTFSCDITQVQKLDSNTESFLYQVTKYFAADPQKNLLVTADSQSNVQNRLITNLYKLNTHIQLEFLTGVIPHSFE